MRHQPLLPSDLDALPWQPLAPGFSMKLIRGGSDADTRALLLRLEPGTVVARHRHDGEIHAFNLSGTRRLDSGEEIGPGGYVYEPPGNIDSWSAIGDVPVVIFLTANGAIEYLDAHDAVLRRTTTGSVTASYREFLQSQR
jgi:2,4'-dihydroxyacetophenone dioxygenase